MLLSYGWIGLNDELWLLKQSTFSLLVISDADKLMMLLLLLLWRSNCLKRLFRSVILQLAIFILFLNSLYLSLRICDCPSRAFGLVENWRGICEDSRLCRVFIGASEGEVPFFLRLFGCSKLSV